MKRDDWQAAAEAEALHTGDRAWKLDFLLTESREAALVVGAALLTILCFLPLATFAPGGWSLAAFLLWLLLIGFGLGRWHVRQGGVMLFGLLLALWLSWDNLFSSQSALSLGGVICLALPSFLGWRMAERRWAKP